MSVAVLVLFRPTSVVGSILSAGAHLIFLAQVLQNWLVTSQYFRVFFFDSA